jgi:hypothetical protein
MRVRLRKRVRLLVVTAMICGGCRDTDKPPPRSAVIRSPASTDSSLAIPDVATSIASLTGRLIPCRIVSAPNTWREAKLQTAPARITLPASLIRVNRPDGTAFLDAWHTEFEQVIATAHRDSMSSDANPISPTCALQSPDGGAIVTYRTFRPRATSPDSIYGGRALFVIDSTTVLELQVSAIGRSRFEALLPVLTTLRVEERR